MMPIDRSSGRQSKAFVACLHNSIAVGTIVADTAHIGHEDARLSWNVGAKIPGVAGGRGEHSTIGHGVDMLNPFVLSCHFSFN